MAVLIVMVLSALLQGGVRVDVAALPAPGGFVDAEFKRRQDSTTDLTRELQRAGVDVGSNTDLRLVVVSSAEEDSGKVRQETRNRPEFLGGGQRTDTEAAVARVVRVELRFRDYRKEIVGVSMGDVPTWTGAAKDAARQIQAWVRDNQARICQESSGSCR